MTSPIQTSEHGHESGASDAAYLQVRNVSIGYPRKGGGFNLACTDVNLDIQRGQFVALVGPSGCGKTTLLEAVAGLKQITSGEIVLDGKAIDGPGRDRSLVFQNASLFPWRNVRKNVTFGLQAHHKLNSETRRYAEELIELVGLAKYAEASPRELSGGMKQRVNVARALATDPNAILLDEPFAALDAQMRELMQRELVRIWGSGDIARTKTALFVTHDVEEAVFLADRVLVFSASPGRVIADIAIDLPRPRVSSTKRDSEFIRMREAVLEALYSGEGQGA